MFAEEWAALIPGFSMAPKGSKHTLPADDGESAKSRAKIASKEACLIAFNFFFLV